MAVSSQMLLLSAVRQQKCLDFMPEDEYDLAGFAVGVVDKKDLITGEAYKGRRCTDRYGILTAYTAMVFLWCVKYLR